MRLKYPGMRKHAKESFVKKNLLLVMDHIPTSHQTIISLEMCHNECKHHPSFSTMLSFQFQNSKVLGEISTMS